MWLSKWKEFINLMNSKGVPLPMVRDPITQVGSVSLSLVIISSFFVIAGIIGNWSNKWGTVDIANALQFFYASCFLYFGRSIPLMGKGTQEATTESKTKQPKADDPDA